MLILITQAKVNFFFFFAFAFWNLTEDCVSSKNVFFQANVGMSSAFR